MLNLCQSQKQFIRQSIAHNTRIDGRRNTTKRSPIIYRNVIGHLPGSSYVYHQYQNTQVYAGIKIKLQQADSIQKLNKVQIALEFSSMRKLREEQNQQMLRIQNIVSQQFIKKVCQSQQMREFLHIEGAKKHKLVMFIDIFLLTQPHISQLQLIIVAIKSALQSTKISQIEVSYNQVTQQQTAQVQSSFREFRKNNWEQIYIVGLIETETQNGSSYIIDMKKQQYQSMDVCFIVKLFQQKVLFIQTIKGSTSIDAINKCVRFMSMQASTTKI